MEVGAGIVRVMLEVTLVLPTAVAVIVTVIGEAGCAMGRAAPLGASTAHWGQRSETEGAVYVTLVAVSLVSVPQPELGQPVPVKDHLTPEESCATVTVRVIESPASMVVDEGLVKVITGFEEPPHPDSPKITARNRALSRKGQEEDMRRRTMGASTEELNERDFAAWRA